jgi:probable rRNA maturation factor
VVRAGHEVVVTPRLRIVTTDGRGRPLAAHALTRWLTRVAPATARGEMAVSLVCDAKMRALNNRYRGIDRPTDVLSFPADSPQPGAPRWPRFLGDVVIATGVAKRQARSIGLPVKAEMRRLALHGLLHLLGYDHEQDSGQMERLERRLLRRGGIKEPA